MDKDNEESVTNLHHDRERPVDLNVFKPSRILGRGSFGTVLLATDTRHNSPVAIKLVSNRPREDYPNLFLDLLQERQIMTFLRGERFCAQLKFATKTKENIWLCMVYYSGGSLKNLIDNIKAKSVRRLNVDDARCYLAELVFVVSRLHKKGIMHRDIKPDNILLDKDGHVVLTDFGFSRRFLPSSRPEKQFCYSRDGTSGFMAPEIMTEKGHTYSADMYAVGATVKELCDEGNLGGDWTNTDLRNLDDLIDGLMKLEPEARLAAKKVCKHPFFRDIDWKYVRAKKLKMPDFHQMYKSGIKNDVESSESELSHFFNNLEEPPKVNGIGLLQHFSEYEGCQ